MASIVCPFFICVDLTKIITATGILVSDGQYRKTSSPLKVTSTNWKQKLYMNNISQKKIILNSF